jgi:hypothetical protein
MQPYVIHLTLDEFLTTPGGVIYAECITRLSTYQGVTTGHSTEILATCRGTEAVHAVRIIVERSNQMQDEVPVGMHERGAAALQLFTHRAMATGRIVAGGLMLVPGLAQDVMAYRTHHDLWTWEGDSAGARRLVPGRIGG